MSGTTDSTLRGLDACGCCQGVSRETPAARFNRPGLSAVLYRAGGWERFRKTLLARLSPADFPAFARLKTRDGDDFTAALLDAFAVMADVLTFYQERNANEVFLRTAVERLSVREMARLTGYELSPGVAAAVYLAFTVEDMSGGTQAKALAARTDPAALTVPPPTWPVIPAGTKVQSVPGPGEQAQTFETVEEIAARPEWNRLRPRLSEPRYPRPGETSAWLAGSPVLEAGDRLLFVGQERLDSPASARWNFRRVVSVQPDSQRGRTRIVWDQPLSNPPAESRIHVFRQRASIFGHNAPDWMSLPKETRLSYLGLGDSAEVPSQYAAEWPVFEIFSPRFPVEPGHSVSSISLSDPALADVAAAASAAAAAAARLGFGGAAGAGVAAVNSAAKIAADALGHSRAAAEKLRVAVSRVAGDAIRAARIPLDSGVAAFDSLIRPAAAVIAQRTLHDLKLAAEGLDVPAAALGDPAAAAGAELERVRTELASLKESLDAVSLGGENPAAAGLNSIDALVGKLKEDLPAVLANVSLKAAGAPHDTALLAEYSVLVTDLAPAPSPQNLMDRIRAWLGGKIQAAIDSSGGSGSGTSPFAEAMDKLTALPGELTDLLSGIDTALANPAGTMAQVIGAVRNMAVSAASASQTIAAEVSRAALETGGSALKQMDSIVRHAVTQAARNAFETVDALNPLPALETLAADASRLAEATEEAARSATEAMAAGAAAGAIDLAVKTELNNPLRTPESVDRAARDDARLAVESAPFLVAAGAAGAAPAEAAASLAGGTGPVSAHAAAATQGAARVQSQVNSAVENALRARFQDFFDGRTFPALTADTIDLDQSYPKIAGGSWIILALPDGPELYRAAEASESSRSAFLLSGKTTRIRLSGDPGALDTRFRSQVRQTAVFAQSEELVLAETPLPDPVWKDEIVMDSAVEGLTAGRTLIVTGRHARRVRVGPTAAPLVLAADSGARRPLYAGTELYAAADPEPVPGTFDKLRWRLMALDGLSGTVDAAVPLIEYVNAAAADGAAASEVVALKSVAAVDETHSSLKLAASLANVYRRDSVTIAANVARATHGESVTEWLGSGDASVPYPAFPLKQAPLTYVASAEPSGASSTLEVRVNDLLWEEVPSLYGRAPGERVYTTELGEDGAATVRFGDGKQGARLPTGTNNVRAAYRKGVGLAGMVAAGRLTQLMTRPLGVKEVVNPLAAEGAQDPESIEDARRNAPLKILTLGRVVSLQDYEDFARAFAGIGKAAATWTWSGERNGIILTVAGPGGAALSAGGAAVTNLVAALHELGDPRVPVEVRPYQPVAFRLRAGVTIAPECEAEKVLAAAESELRAAFSFDAREFGQPVALSEVAAVMHRAEGVTAVHVTELYREDQPAGRNPLLFAFLPRAGTDSPRPGELLTIQEDPVSLEVLP